MSTVANLFSGGFARRVGGADRTAAASRRAATHHPPRRPARQPPCATSSRTRKRPSAPSRLSCEFARSLPAVDEGPNVPNAEYGAKKTRFRHRRRSLWSLPTCLLDARPAHHHARSVKEQMLFDHCTWDDDYKRITQDIRAPPACASPTSRPKRYTAVLMQGSGTFWQRIRADERGRRRRARARLRERRLYGDRLLPRSPPGGRAPSPCTPSPTTPPSTRSCTARTWPPTLHHARGHGAQRNDVGPGQRHRDPQALRGQARGAAFIVDAMSSFGGIDIPVEDWGIDFIVSSANKCIQGVPGFSFAICRRDLLEGSRGKARAACRSTCTPSGRPWSATAGSGASPRPPTRCSPSPRPCASWRRRAA